MFIDEFARIVNSFDIVGEQVASDLMGVVLEQIKSDTGAATAELWMVTPGREDDLLLRPIKCLVPEEADNKKRNPFGVNKSTKGMLARASLTGKPVWLDDVPAQREAGTLTNKRSGERIPPDLFDWEKLQASVIALPAIYRDKVRGVLAITSTQPNKFGEYDFEALTQLSSPTGNLCWKVETFEQNCGDSSRAVSSFKRSVRRDTDRLSPFRTGFIARPFGGEKSCEALEKRLKSDFEHRGVRAAVYDHPPGGGVVVLEIINQIAAAHFGVADLTCQRPNVLVELGMLIGLKKPFLLFRDRTEDRKMPFDVAGYHLYEYEIEGDQLKLFEPNSSEPKSANGIVSRFIDEHMKDRDDWEQARKWFGGPR